MRHDGAKKLFARLAREVYQDVQVEPPLTELNGEKMDLKSANIRPDARADVRIRSFYTVKQNAFFDFRAFYPFAKSFSGKAIDTTFDIVAKAKKREYGDRINQLSRKWSLYSDGFRLDRRNGKGNEGSNRTPSTRTLGKAQTALFSRGRLAESQICFRIRMGITDLLAWIADSESET